MKDLVGRKYNRWTVVEMIEADRLRLICKCECGAVKIVRKSHVLDGGSKSCGCLHKERASQRAGNMHAANTKHGLSRSPVYGVFAGMHTRCENKANKFYKYYGGRGITVCDRWAIFENFISDMGIPAEGMTIDRIDNSKGYSPENCRWATRIEQQNNRDVCRNTTWNGETNTIAEWSRKTGIHHNTITQRLDAGLPLNQVFSPEKRHDISGLALGAKISQSARLARTHCKHGHEYTPENTLQTEKQRYCRTCHRERQNARNAAKRRTITELVLR